MQRKHFQHMHHTATPPRTPCRKSFVIYEHGLPVSFVAWPMGRFRYCCPLCTEFLVASEICLSVGNCLIRFLCIVCNTLCTRRYHDPAAEPHHLELPDKVLPRGSRQAVLVEYRLDLTVDGGKSVPSLLWALCWQLLQQLHH